MTGEQSSVGLARAASAKLWPLAKIAFAVVVLELAIHFTGFEPTVVGALAVLMVEGSKNA